MGLAVRVRAARQLLTESMWVTLNQVLFSVASVVATAFVARSASAHDAASVFAVYALESIVLTSCRGFVITAPLLRHRGSTLCPGDVAEAYRVLFAIALLAVVPYAALGFWLSRSVTTALIAAGWATATFYADIVRQIAVAFGRRVAATTGVGVYLAAIVVLQLVGRGLSFRGFLVGVAVLSLALAAFVWVIGARHVERHGCGFWRRERAFAGSQAAEGAGAVSMVSVTFLVLARVAPAQLVGLQVASQALIGPALVLANGFAIPFTRRASLKQQAGHSEVGVLMSWGLILVVCMGSASAASGLGSGLFTRVFGSAWDDAARLVPALAVQAIAFVGAQIALTRYRSRLEPRPLRWFWLLLVGVGYGTILVGVVVGGAADLAASIWVSDGLMLALAAAAVLGFERRLPASAIQAEPPAL